MAPELSPQAEAYLAGVVAGGLFPSKEAALEAAVDALREKTEPIPMVPAEDMDRVERSIEAANAGQVRPMTPEYWDSLRRKIRGAASGRG